jgi:hypothetical protein
MERLLVAGCSFSDYTKVAKVYGEYVAKTLGLDYIHEARGCGSNYRIWRTVVNAVLDGKIKSDDLVIIQYTTIERQEFWSPYRRPIIPINDDENNSDPYDASDTPGTIIRFKIDSHTWQTNPREKEFFRLHETFLCEEFEDEKFIVNHNMFQSFMKDNGFKNLYFLLGGNYAPHNLNYIDYYKNNVINGDYLLRYHLPKDKFHLSAKGHKHAANLIEDFLQQRKNK